jgi:uncharacterized membrane protein
MAEYDGSVRINTKIDNDDFVSGMKEIITALKDIQKAISDMGARIEGALGKINTSKVITQVVKMEAKTKTSANNMGKSIQKIQDSLDELYEKRGRFESGMFPNLGDNLTAEQQKTAEASKQWQKYTAQINKASASLDVMIGKLGKNTSATQSGNARASKANSIYKTMASGIKKASSAFAKFSLGIKKSIKNFKMSDTLVGKMAKSFQRLGNMIKTAIVYYALFSAIQAVTEISKALLKTNADVVNSYAQIKGNLMTAFMPIWQAVLPALNALMSYLVRATGYIAQFTNALFGKSIKASQEMAKSMYNQATATDEVAKSTKEANKQLSAQDELNVIAKQETPKATADEDVIAPTFNTIGLSDKVNGYIEALKKAFETGNFIVIGTAIGFKINEAMENIDWDRLKAGAEKAGRSVATLLNGIILATDWTLLGKTMAEGLNTVTTAINGFADSFNFLGAGINIADTINGMLGNIDWALINETSDNLSKGLADIFNGFMTLDWSLVGTTIANALNTITNFASNFIKEFDWTKLGSSISTGLNSLFADTDWSKMAKTFSDGLRGLFATLNTFLFEFDWAGLGEDFVDLILGIDWWGLFIDTLVAIIGVGKAIIDLTNGIYTAISDAIIDAGTKALKGALDLGKNIIKSLVSGVTSLYETLKKTFGGVWTKIKAVFVNANPIFSGFAKGMIDGIKNGFSWELVKNTIKNIWTNIKNIFVNAHPIFSGIAKGMLNGIKNGFSWELVKNTIKNIWTNIKNSFSNAFSVFSTIGSNMLKGIKEKLTGDALKKALTKPFTTAINAIITLFNSMIKTINKALKFSWGDIKIAGKTVIDKGSITIAKLPEIPGLATGTVVPANYGNFLATLGDAKVPEIVSPIDMMAKTFDGVMQKYIQQLAGSGNITIKIGEREIFQVMREQARIYERQTHKKPW